MTRRIRTLALYAGLSLLTLNTGCAALIDAAIRDADDDGPQARYEHKTYGEHFLDALLEDDDDDCRCTTTVVVHDDCQPHRHHHH